MTYTGVDDQPKNGGHILGAEYLEAGLVRVWCSCGWRGDEHPSGTPPTQDDRHRLGKAWASHVSLSTGIARSVLS